MSLYQNLISLTFATADPDNISVSQSPGAAGNLTITGDLASAGVATMDAPRRVLITSGGDDSANTFIVTGTGSNGLLLSESILGSNAGSVYTNHDFATVTSVHISAASGGTVTVGTNGVGSSIPVIMDTIVNPAVYGAAVIITGTVNYSIEMSYDDFAPAWDLNANTPTWFPVAPEFSSQSSTKNGTIQGPCTMIRLTVNSGAGTASLKLIKPLIAGPF